MSQPWSKVPLGEVLIRSDETVTLEPDAEYRELTVKLWGKGIVLRRVVTGAQVAAPRRYIARTGQFVLSRIDARNGALGIVPPGLDGAIVSNDFPAFNVIRERLEPAFLGWLCRTNGFVEDCRRASEGTTNRVRIQEAKLLATKIRLPPLAEQLRLMARIEAIAVRISEAENTRATTLRATHTLVRLVLRRAIEDCEADNVELGHVCEAIIDNLHSNPRYADSGVPCVRSPDVGWGRLDLDRALLTDEAEYIRRTVRGEPRPGDIVFVREGGGTGKCALVLPGQRFSLGQRVMMLRPNTKRVLPQYMLYHLLAPTVQEDQIAPLSKGSASPHLNIESLRRFRFRLPILDEQARIVTDLNKVQSHMQALNRLQVDTHAELDALLPAVLDRAFRGEL